MMGPYSGGISSADIFSGLGGSGLGTSAGGSSVGASLGGTSLPSGGMGGLNLSQFIQMLPMLQRVMGQQQQQQQDPRTLMLRKLMAVNPYQSQYL
jgi:hypothetical protein